MVDTVSNDILERSTRIVLYGAGALAVVAAGDDAAMRHVIEDR